MESPISLTPPPGAVVPRRHPDAPRPGTVLGPHAVGCFACGPRPEGLRVETTIGEGLTAVGRFLVERPHEGSPGIAHGGLLATAFDETMSGLFTLQRVKMVTGSLQVTFRRPVPVGSELFLPVSLDAQVGRQYYASGEGRLGSVHGPLALRAHAVFFEIDMDHFQGFAGSDEMGGFNPELRGAPN